MRFLNERSDRIDTTITQVAVRRGDGNTKLTAANYVTRQFPRATVLAVWSAHERDSAGNPVFNVEWEEEAE